jgi:HEPN domain-containing protein
MRNEGLARDYVKRARSRLRAIGVLMEDESWADVMRESQEAVEILLKALLRTYRIEVPQIHDVGAVLAAEKDRFPAELQEEIEGLKAISKSLRRDRELAFYGSEDLTPSEFYGRSDADAAYQSAKHVFEVVARWVQP